MDLADLEPGVGFGDYTLGLELTETLHIISLQRPAKTLRISYDEEEPVHGLDILVTVLDDGVVLHFNPDTQRLSLISLCELDKVQLSRAGTVFTGSTSAPTFVSIYRLFGPTFPGRFVAGADGRRAEQ
eukprot:TRINITY_DN30395_c0_g1_i1.p1 TRINITY_DN30395_c0_g1~~TRINITY_DN30395_c0_g1_i1.p1  ORF type:complete len:128 (+),score=12.11 TRINITY_DN30395_c0_g1_i1:174-557(+)